MKRRIGILFGLLASVASGTALADAKFEHLAVRVEQNVTDNDFEVVFEATSGDTAFAALKVAAPDGRIVIDFKSPNTKLGMRSFRFETPEPKSLSGLQADYPAGQYTFSASTVSGLNFSDVTSLSHKLPAAATFLRPRPDELGVPVNGLRVEWRAPTGLKSCLVAIENDVTGVTVVQATLAGGATTFSVPNGVLAPGTVYKVAIGTVATDGNASYIETSFTTAKAAAKK